MVSLPTAVRRSKSAAVKPGRGKTGELVQLLCDLITYVLPVAYFQKTMSYPQKITQAPLQPMCFGSKPSDYNLSMVKESYFDKFIQLHTVLRYATEV